ncbi:hypothetical protein HC928_18905 [bacterium]|nr:hypothetical protein [bacterium]
MIERSKATLVIGLVTLSIVFMNLFAAIAVPGIVSADEGTGQQAEIFGAEMLRTIGAFDTPVGLGVMVVSAVLLTMAFGLLNNRSWEVAAMFFLGADITLKLVNIAAMLATGGAFADTLLAFGIIAVEAGLIGVLFRRYVDNRRVMRSLAV